MLRIEGSSKKLCDGVSRRKFIEVGTLSAFGLSISDLLRGEANAAVRSKVSGSPKSVILIWQHGGPSQLDTFDMKMDQPEEVRGPYQPINTNVPGIQVSELMKYHAKVMDHCSIIRSFTHGNGDHWAAAHWMLTGYLGATGADRVARNPAMGAIASKLLGPVRTGVPAGININDGGFGFHGGAHLGVAHNPFRIGDFSYGNEAGRLPTGSDKSFKLTDGLSADRLMNRVSLMSQFDQLRRDVDARGTFGNLDEINNQAREMLLSGRARRAFKLDEEDVKLREKYGPGWGEQALLARRFIEAGVRFVTLNTGYWDDHGNIKRALDSKMVRHDRAVGVLIEDLANRGLLESTLVVTAGEFGRTPKINKDAGRDHWPQAQSILVAGGGYKGGQFIGSTNSKAEHPTSRPVKPADFNAILYHALGLKPDDTINNVAGRPVHLAPNGVVPRELL
ncbi:DUF1501 domain-containing protein [Pirellulaceae bacterium]|jgi:hypothetical protein|nr:DUF1501 domain-containing protein [Mariniblastus sp.]MDB4756889.1 DUF1501 domain-containing protein [Mariniblastus sp.]MDB4794185.1 DUF1501 domain-containing protein [Pirellulaceae bacterium]